MATLHGRGNWPSFLGPLLVHGRRSGETHSASFGGNALAVLGLATRVDRHGAAGAGDWLERAGRRVLLLEAALLGVACSCLQRRLCVTPITGVNGLIVLMGSVMGMQGAAVRPVHMAGVCTTFIAGTLTEWVAGLVEHALSEGLPLARVLAPSMPFTAWLPWSPPAGGAGGCRGR